MLFAFYLCKANGDAASFEIIELASEQGVAARAERLLAEHPSCAYVNVWSGNRKVLARHRENAST